MESRRFFFRGSCCFFKAPPSREQALTDDQRIMVQGIIHCDGGLNCDMGVSKNNGTPKSSILIGFSIINHPFWGTPILGNIHIWNNSSLEFGRIYLQGGMAGPMFMIFL